MTRLLHSKMKASSKRRKRKKRKEIWNGIAKEVFSKCNCTVLCWCWQRMHGQQHSFSCGARKIEPVIKHTKYACHLCRRTNGVWCVTYGAMNNQKAPNHGNYYNKLLIRHLFCFELLLFQNLYTTSCSSMLSLRIN